MGKPWALRLLRSCLFFSGRKVNDETETRTSPAAMAPVMFSLPEDIIFDVLSRLPVKTLCQLRCVSKGWHALISDPAFAAAQGSRAAAVAPLVVGVFGRPCPLEKFYGPPRPPARFLSKLLELRVIDTADGTILRVVQDVKGTKLMRARLGLVFVDLGEFGASVIDPATEQVLTKVSRQPPDQRPVANYNGTSSIVIHMACHFSFGRATLSGTYKILRLRDVMLLNRGVVETCQIATLSEGNVIGEWRQRPEAPIFTCNCSDCVAFVDGVLHFMARGADAPTHGRRPGRSPGWNRIASFDLESEEWKMVMDGPPAECREEERWDLVLAELKGTLSVVQTVWSPTSPTRTNIWLLIDPKKSLWVKEYTVHMPESCLFFRALEIMVDGRILMLNCFGEDYEDMLNARCKLQFYDPSTHALTNLLEMSEEFRGPLTLYKGNLLS